MTREVIGRKNRGREERRLCCLSVKGSEVEKGT